MAEKANEAEIAIRHKQSLQIRQLEQQEDIAKRLKSAHDSVARIEKSQSEMLQKLNDMEAELDAEDGIDSLG